MRAAIPLLELRQDERVHRVPDPRPIPDLRRAAFRTGWNDQWRRASSDDVRPWPVGHRAVRGSGAPSFTHDSKSAMVCVGKLGLLRRHLQPVFVPDRLEEHAAPGITGHDGRAGVAPLDHGLARVEPQAAADLLRPVALDARAGQDRPYFPFEECFGVIARRLPACREVGAKRDQQEEGGCRPPGH